MEQQLQKLTQAILARGELLEQLQIQYAAIQASVEEMKPIRPEVKMETKPAEPVVSDPLLHAEVPQSVTPPAQASSSRSLATGELDALMPTGCSMNCPNDDTDSRTSAFMPDAAPGPPSTAALLDVASTSPEPTDSTILVRDGTGELTPTPSGTAVHPVDLGDEHVPNLSNCQLGARKVFDRMCGTDGISYGFSTNGLVLTTCCPDESSTAGIAVVDRAARRREGAHRILILARLGNLCGAMEFRQPWPPPAQVGVMGCGVELRPMSRLSIKGYRGRVKWMPPWSPPVPGRILIPGEGFWPAKNSTEVMCSLFSSNHMRVVSEEQRKRGEFLGNRSFYTDSDEEVVSWTMLFSRGSSYFLQATQQLSDRWKLMRMGEDPLVEVWIADNLPDEAVIGIDPWCISVDSAQRYGQTFSKKRQTLFQLSADLVDEIWKDRPPTKPLPVIVHPVEFAGRSIAERIKELREKLQHEKASAIIITALDEVAWLYNIRGDDVHYSPVVHSYAIVTLHNVFFYVDKRKVTAEVQNYMTENGIDIREYNMVQSDVSLLVSGHGIVYIGILLYKTVFTLKKSTMFDESQVEQFANEISMDSGKGVRLAKWLFMQLKPDGVVYTTLSHFIQHVGKNILEGLIVMFCQLHGGCNIDPENWLKEWLARTEIHVLFCDMVCVLIELNYDLFATRDTSIWQVEHHTTKIIALDPWRNKLQSGEKVMIEIRKGERLQSLGLNGNPVLNKAASSYWIVAIDALYELEIYNSHVARKSLLLGLPLADHAWKQYWNYRVYKCLCRVMFRAYSHTWCLGVVVFDIGQVWGYLICLQLWKLRLNMSIMSLGAHQFSFPLANSWRQVHSKLHGQMQEQASLPDSNSTNLICIFVKSFLASRPMQVAVYHCLHNGLESAIHASLQLISRACLLNASFCVIICGPSNSSSDVNEVEYGGDGTIVSDMCSWLSLCGSYLNKESKQNSNQKCKLSNPHALVVHCCLALVAIAVCLKSEGKSSASYILTISQKKQRSRLSVLAHLSSVDDTVKSCLQPHCASAMLALSSLISLENGGQTRSSLCETALALFPRMATLHTLLKLWLSDGSEALCRYNAGLLNLFGLRDGSIGLLETRLKWGGPLAIEQACSVGIPQLLIRLLTDGFSKEPSDGKEGSTHRSGLSPLGVVWTLSALSQCLPGGVFREILYKREHVKLLTDLLCDMHLKALEAWTGLGGGKRGVRELINSVVDILAFPFVAVQSSPNMPSTSASINSGFLLNIASPGGRIGSENKEMLKTIEHNMPQYIQVLLEVAVPGCILRCLDYVDMEDLARPLAIVAKMVGYRPLALQLLREGLLNPSRVAKLLKGPIAKETLLDFLMIVSDLARMSKDFYEPIDKAGMVGFLKDFLSNEDPDIRAKACSAIGNMCRHSPYFYSPLAANTAIELVVDRCSDPDKRTRKFACFAVGNAAYHNDMLYEELRPSIPQLTKLLLAPEEDKTKGNAAGALSNLVRNSDILCEDIVSQGAIQALLKMVSSYSTVALSPSRRDALTESPLRIVLFALRKMCDHTVCRLFLRSSELLPIIVHLRQSPDPTISEYASAIASKAHQA